MTGQIFTGGGGRIVGPEAKAIALAEAINDLELQVAFIDGGQAIVYTRAMMRRIGVDHPVLGIPYAVREQFEADPERPAHLQVIYTGPLPTAADGGRITPFDIVKPGDHHE